MWRWIWEQALVMASDVGWGMTVDMFAASCNARLPRIMTWTDEASSQRAV